MIIVRDPNSFIFGYSMASEITTVQYPKVYLYKRIVQAKLFIDSNYANKIDIDNICDEACFSKFHFIRVFKKVYGKTPHQYLTSVRIENAKLLFKEDNAVTEVCYAGYSAEIDH